MDVTWLTECVKPDGNEVVADVFFQTLFGVSPSHELSLQKTDRGVALEMLRHCGIFTAWWQTSVGTNFECNQFELNGLQYRLVVKLYNCHQPYRYQVSMLFNNLVKYQKSGDNLVRLFFDALKSEFLME
jgi:hypothetical protein